MILKLAGMCSNDVRALFRYPSPNIVVLSAAAILEQESIYFKACTFRHVGKSRLKFIKLGYDKTLSPIYSFISWYKPSIHFAGWCGFFPVVLLNSCSNKCII